MRDLLRLPGRACAASPPSIAAAPLPARQLQRSSPLPSPPTRMYLCRALNSKNPGLTGTIPSELGGLTALTKLWLYQISLDGPIFPALMHALLRIPRTLQRRCPPVNCDAHHPSLPHSRMHERRLLHKNLLTGTIPSALSGLTVLASLNDSIGAGRDDCPQCLSWRRPIP